MLPHAVVPSYFFLAHDKSTLPSCWRIASQADAREEASGGGIKKATAMPRAKRRRVGSSGGMGSRGRDGAEVPNGRN